MDQQAQNQLPPQLPPRQMPAMPGSVAGLQAPQGHAPAPSLVQPSRPAQQRPMIQAPQVMAGRKLGGSSSGVPGMSPPPGGRGPTAPTMVPQGRQASSWFNQANRMSAPAPAFVQRPAPGTQPGRQTPAPTVINPMPAPAPMQQHAPQPPQMQMGAPVAPPPPVRADIGAEFRRFAEMAGAQRPAPGHDDGVAPISAAEVPFYLGNVQAALGQARTDLRRWWWPRRMVHFAPVYFPAYRVPTLPAYPAACEACFNRLEDAVGSVSVLIDQLEEAAKNGTPGIITARHVNALEALLKCHEEIKNFAPYFPAPHFQPIY